MMGALRITCLALLSAAIAAAQTSARGPLPAGTIPPGKVFLVVQPHHDDHTTDYGMGGLIARLVGEGYTGYYIRASNDEKDGPHGYPLDDMINLKECITATRILGIKDVFSLNWRNDYMDAIPRQELRAQIILLIRKLRPDVVLGHDPWAHYDRNPDHRKVARALGDAFWLAGYANVHPEHLAAGLKPYRVPYLFLKARVDYGRGHEANVAMELNAEQVHRKQKAYVAHRNVYSKPATATRMRKLLQAENLVVDAIEDKTDQDAAILFDEWHMEWISRKRGAENNLPYAEIYWRIEEFDHLPGLKDYIRENAVKK